MNPLPNANRRRSMMKWDKTDTWKEHTHGKNRGDPRHGQSEIYAGPTKPQPSWNKHAEYWFSAYLFLFH